VENDIRDNEGINLMTAPNGKPGAKKVDDLSIADFEAFPVWQFTDADEQEMDETAVRPVNKLPAKIGGGYIVGTKVSLSNGMECWARLGNLDPEHPRKTAHFLGLSVFKNGLWFHLARYHDFDASSTGPLALAGFLGLPINEVFPIHYDLTRICIGNPAVLIGQIDAKPREVLSHAELIALAIP
jgi:hypothetical protein